MPNDYFITSKGVFKKPNGSNSVRYYVTENNNPTLYGEHSLSNNRLAFTKSKYLNPKAEFYADPDSYAALLSAGYRYNKETGKRIRISQGLDRHGMHSGKGKFDVAMFDITMGSNFGDDSPVTYGQKEYNHETSVLLAKTLKDVGFSYLIGPESFPDSPFINKKDKHHNDHFHAQGFRPSFLTEEQYKDLMNGLDIASTTPQPAPTNQVSGNPNPNIPIQEVDDHDHDHETETETPETPETPVSTEPVEQPVADAEPAENIQSDVDKAVADAQPKEETPQEETKSQSTIPVDEEANKNLLASINSNNTAMYKNMAALRNEYMTELETLKSNYSDLEEAYKQREEKPDVLNTAENYQKVKDIYRYLRT